MSEISMDPVTRKEFYLAEITGMDVDAPAPVTRLETYLNDIINGTASQLVPVTRVETYLAKISGADVTIPAPVTRLELYLAKIAGMDVEVPDPVTREEHWLWMWANAGPVGTETTVSGEAPITLANAVRGAIRSLIQYGQCYQATTPTPDAPVDIVCNNGTLRMVHRSGLPSGYRLLEYVGGSGSQYVITDLYLASTDVIECEYRNSSTTGYGAVYGIFKTGESSALYGNQTYYGYDESNNKVDTDIRVDTEWHSSRHDFVNGTLTIDGTTVTFTPFTFVNSTKNAVLSRYYNGSYGYNWKGYIRKFKVTRNGEVVCDLLPAKNSNNVAGLYDLISGSFYQAAAGTLLEGNEVDDYELRVVGNPEVLSVAGQTASVPNLFGVDNRQDWVDIISGEVRRMCGVLVLDGTEDWQIVPNYSYFALYNIEPAGPIPTRAPQNPRPISTHFPHPTSAGVPYLKIAGDTLQFYYSDEFSDIDVFKAWLAAQYAAGTPVIMVYKLEEGYFEQTTTQRLQLSEGSNTVSVVANVSPVELECTYIAADA